jgi:hypothetical protein
VLQASGAQLLEALENGVSMYPKLEGRFPQVLFCRCLLFVLPLYITLRDMTLPLPQLYLYLDYSPLVVTEGLAHPSP